MNYAIAKLLRTVFFCAVFSAWLVAALWEQNVDQIADPSSLLVHWMVVAVLAGILCILFFTSTAWNDGRVFAIVSSIVVGVFLYGSLGYRLQKFGLEEHPLRWWAVLLVAITVSGWAISRYRTGRLVLLTLFCVVSLNSIAFWTCRCTLFGQQAATAMPKAENVAALPNVYHIVVNSYAREDQLHKVFGFDNSAFIRELEARHFQVSPNSFANYPVTYLSLAATLQQEYPLGGGAHANAAEHDPLVPILQGKNETRKFFQSLGYRYAHYQNVWWPQTNCATPFDRCIGGYSLLKQADVAFLKNTPLLAALDRFAPRLLAYLTKETFPSISNLIQVIPLSNDGPWYLFAHVMSPHYPYWYTELCEPREGPENENWREEDRALYINEIKCLNRDLLKLIDHIRDQDKKAVVLIHSDSGSNFLLHGKYPTFDNWTAAQIHERLGIFAAFLLPDQCRSHYYDGISPVNFMRLVSSCIVKDRDPGFLEDRSYLTSAARKEDTEYGAVQPTLVPRCRFGLAEKAAVLCDPSWREIPNELPASASVLSMVERQRTLFIGSGRRMPQGGEIFALTPTGFRSFGPFSAQQITSLEADDTGTLYVGVGTPHQPGAALFGQYGAADDWTTLKTFASHDAVRAMEWHNGQLYLGVTSEDSPGTAEVWRFDHSGLTQVGGIGIAGWPESGDFGLHKLWSYSDHLYCAVFSRTREEGRILKLTSAGWINVDTPDARLPVAAVSYGGALIVAFGGANLGDSNPVFQLAPDGTWQPFGTAPSEWQGAAPNHLLVGPDGNLYATDGKGSSTLSLWRYHGQNWVKIGGGGVYRSWTGTSRDESIDGLFWHDLRLYVGISSRQEGAPKIWEMTPTGLLPIGAPKRP